MTASQLLDLLHQNGITYIFVGAVERGQGVAAGGDPNERVTAQAENLFKSGLATAFTSGDTVIYQVSPP